MSELFSMRLCSKKSAYEVRLNRSGRINLLSVSKTIASIVKMRSRVSLPEILILENDSGKAITMFPDGKMLLRGFESPKDAERIAHMIADALVET